MASYLGFQNMLIFFDFFDIFLGYVDWMYILEKHVEIFRVFKHMSSFDPSKPFNGLPLLPPLIELEIPIVLKACIEANKELAQLKMAEKLIPNQTVLINSIPLLESQASSAIENIVTTTDDLFKFADSHSSEISHEVKETLRYRSALYHGIISIKNRPINVSTICEICSTIREVDVNIRNLPGTALTNDLTKVKIYTPPEGEELLRKLLSNWQTYLHTEDGVDPLIKLAVQHYQLEAIHPFTDGNGRTGRIVNLLYLVEKNLLETPILYLSRYIIQNKSQYYEKLLKVTQDSAWIEWILYFLEAIKQTASWTTKKIISIHELISETCAFVLEKAPQIYKKELVELLFIQPYVRITNLTEHNLGERQTASKHLKILCSIGVLEEVTAGREKLFINKRFLNLLKEK